MALAQAVGLPVGCCPARSEPGGQSWGLVMGEEKGVVKGLVGGSR